MTTLTDARLVRPGPESVFRGRLGGEEVIVKRVSPSTPWTDRQSSFFGGYGIAPPFVPLPLHEAAAWRRLEPERVLAAEATDDATWLVLRAIPGSPPSGSEDPHAFLVGLLQGVARLHAADVVHRDVRPANVLVHNGHVALIDLDVARVAGVGPVGVVGARAFRAPETWAGEGDERVDLYGVGATMRALFPALPAPLQALVDALLDEPVSRPSARDALARLGVDAPPPAVSPPHFWARAWWSAGWADALVLGGRYAEVVRRADRAGAEVPVLAALASRLLGAAPRAGREAWLALGALCWTLHAATQDPRYAVQSDEARVYARASWHPSARALDALLTRDTPAWRRTDALCELDLATLALEGAVKDRSAPRTARAAWALGDAARVDAALRASHADPMAVSVAASRVLLAAPHRADAAVVRAALRGDVLEAVRLLLARGDHGAAASLAAELPPPPEAQVLVCLVSADLDGARAAAQACVQAGAWSPAVAVLVLGAPQVDEATRSEAARIVTDSLPPAPTDRDAQESLGALARGGGATAWGRLAVALTGVGRPDLLVEAVGRAEPTAGPWRLLVAQLAADSTTASVAALVWERAAAQFPYDAPLQVLGASLALARGDHSTALACLAAARAVAPDHGPAWLLEALLAPDPAAARRALASAEAFGVPAELVRVVAEARRGSGSAAGRP